MGKGCWWTVSPVRPFAFSGSQGTMAPQLIIRPADSREPSICRCQRPPLWCCAISMGRVSNDWCLSWRCCQQNPSPFHDYYYRVQISRRIGWSLCHRSTSGHDSTSLGPFRFEVSQCQYCKQRLHCCLCRSVRQSILSGWIYHSLHVLSFPFLCVCCSNLRKADLAVKIPRSWVLLP